MFWNNLKIALRTLRKNKLFAVINIAGLALGMTIYVLGGLIVKYEGTHDLFFAKADRTYTLGAYASPELNVGIDQLNAVFSAVGPIVESELSDVEAVARTLRFEYLVTMGDSSFYQTILFTDPALLEIFDFEYVGGGPDALTDPSGVVITEASAIKYFGDTDVVGKVITLDNEFDFTVAAVIEDVPQNSHFNSSLVQEGRLEMLAPIKALGPMRDFDEAGDYNNWSLGNMTYVLLPPGLDGAWLQAQMDGIYERIVPEDAHDVITGFMVKPLVYANLAVWDTIGIPVVKVIQLLSFLVLLIACVNYTNLATAQSLGRSREVGMRKTMGAGQGQLLSQFLLESLVIASIAMVVAIAVLEVVIPLLNNTANKALSLDYLRTLPWLVATTVVVGLCAGLYPAWLITRASPIDALRDEARKGKKGSRMRSVMIGVQFAISAFMLSLVAIVYMQNQKVDQASYIFPRSEIYTLTRLGVDDIRASLETLRNELEALPVVEAVSFSSQVPFEQSNSQAGVSPNPGDEAAEIALMQMRMTPEFLTTYDIPLLAGRNLSRDVANDEFRSEESETLNVLVNELALAQLGFGSPQEAINQRFYDTDEESTLREFVIAGVVPTQNILGLFNAEKPWVFFYAPESFRIGSVRIRAGSNFMESVEAVEDVWKRVVPDYPMQGEFLDDTFNDVYKVLNYMNLALAGFAFIALTLAMIGLFGLAAFMAAQRTKEIGVRKVLGASSLQIARLLVWQFSKPVLWALVVALPAAYLASTVYLDFFADRITSPILTLVAAGVISVVLAWGTVAGHALRIARANPVLALRYE